MARKINIGHLQFCIDLGFDSDSTSLVPHQQMAHLALRLVQMFDRYAMPATWAFHGCFTARIPQVILRSKVPHEFAWLGSTPWLGAHATRSAVADYLKEARCQADECGIDVSTLVLSDLADTPHHDLLVRHGITSLRPAAGSHSGTRRDPVAPVGGTWCVPATAVFPAAGRFLGRFDRAFRAKQALYRSLAGRGTEHVAVRTADMLRQPETHLRSLERVVRLAAQLRAARRIRCETVRDGVLRWQPIRGTRPQQSILKKVA